jgi:protein arginine kinase activator
MPYECDKCGKPASIHLTEISGGQKVEKHLCAECAAAENLTDKVEIPISQLLEDFVLQSGGAGKEFDQRECDVCGMTFAEFRAHGLLGCPNDYEVFEDLLDPMLDRAHEDATQHLGKVPKRAGADQQRATELLRLRAELKTAVTQEDYERAASLRDTIREMENE